MGPLGLALCLALTAGGCSRPAAASPFGDVGRGRVLVGRFACGSCHLIPGQPAGDGLVGPPLAAMGERAMIAGLLPNTPENLARWVRNPQAVSPGAAMPDEGLDARQARDVSAYLSSLR